MSAHGAGSVNSLDGKGAAEHGGVAAGHCPSHPSGAEIGEGVPTIADMPNRTAPHPTAEAEALGAVLFRAHEAARHLENLLELEAPDPRVGALMQDAKRIRKSIAALLVDVAIEAVAIEVPA